MDEVIVILSEDEDIGCDATINNSSVLIVEDKENVVPDRQLSSQALEEDLVVTFSRRAEVLPHARYDCPVYPFTRTHFEKYVPIESNHQICEQCFCYICDKLASQCALWCVREFCHCNSHQKSAIWSGLRKSAVLGHLIAFDFSLSDVDSKLQLAERLLRSFRQDLAVEYSCFIRGKVLSSIGLPSHIHGRRVHNYTPVYERLSLFLDTADEQEGRVAAVMHLGAAKDFIAHYQPAGLVLSKCPKANAIEATRILFQRVIYSVRRLIVMSDLPSSFIDKLMSFYQGLNVHPIIGNPRNGLHVRLWDDVLLVSVLKGQNVTGIRTYRSKRDILLEGMSVVLMRVELLQSQRRYRELCRYLRVVQTDDIQLFEKLRGFLPLFMCMAGDFPSALSAVWSSSTRLTPALFRLYLRVFDTAAAPRVHIGPQMQLDIPESKWGPIQGAEPLKRVELVKFALRVQRCSEALNTDAQTWAHLLTIVNTPRDSASPMPEPCAQFLYESKTVARGILTPVECTNIQIPKSFLEVYPDQALLLLVTEALVLRLLHGPLSPSLPVIKSFKDNSWALHWLCMRLSLWCNASMSFMQQVQQELDNNTGDQVSNLLPAPPSSPPPSSSSEPLDHTYCSPVSVKGAGPPHSVPNPTVVHPFIVI